MDSKFYSLEEVAAFYQQEREPYPEAFRLRIHRSLSWLKRADELVCLNGKHHDDADWDLAFITIWIAFNAAYAKDLQTQTAQDKVNFREFLQCITQMDKKQEVYALIWQRFSSEIRALLENRYVFQPFWDWHNGVIAQADFEEKEAKSKAATRLALQEMDTSKILWIVFDRLYTLRNQLIHGGATHGSKANRLQIKAAYGFLRQLLPVMLMIMMQEPNRESWGKPFYPYVKE
ncbi:MAG: HEPN domain-containing protein [Neisseria sp.]|nr:HEPN domain-containing protein [Neisseria sp.]